MTILVDKGAFVAVAVDDSARSLIKPGDTILVLASIRRDDGDVVQVRIGDDRCAFFGCVPWSAIAVLTERAGALLDRAEGDKTVD